MFQNIKTDIIYYKTNTDFEMEFNLCGCCRMRLLSDKCSDKKALVHSLARAVSRSTVIIMVAPLFSEENTMKIVAEAIGTTTDIVNNKEFGISSNDEIDIIKNSTPLVTADGVLGGCIIESGPQSLIILTDNNHVRKTIMKTLIHPYIRDIYTSNASTESILPNEEVAEATEDAIQDVSEEPILKSTFEEAAVDPSFENEEATTEIIFDSQEDEQITTSQDVNLEDSIIFDIENNDESQEDPYLYDDNEFIFDDEEQNSRKSFFTASQDDNYVGDTYKPAFKTAKSSKLNIVLLIVTIILLLSLATLCFSIFYIPAKEGIDPATYLQDIFSTMFKA